MYVLFHSVIAQTVMFYHFCYVIVVLSLVVCIVFSHESLVTYYCLTIWNLALNFKKLCTILGNSFKISVINVTLPDDKANYIHRIGRTGRAER